MSSTGIRTTESQNGLEETLKLISLHPSQGAFPSQYSIQPCSHLCWAALNYSSTPPVDVPLIFATENTRVSQFCDPVGSRMDLDLSQEASL